MKEYQMRATLKEIGEAEGAAERRDAVVAAVQAGNGVDAVAVVVQLPEETVRAWVREEEERILRQRMREGRTPAR
jgi:transposase